MADPGDLLRIERRGHAAWVVLDNPPANGVTPEMHAALARVFPRLDADPEVRVIVVTGAGEEGFCAAGDIRRIEAGLDDHARWAASVAEARAIVLGMLDCDTPVVGRINGHAIGFGATLALLCDITVAREDIRIGDTHVRVGLVAGDGGALIWPLLVGLNRAKQYLLTGRLLTGREAADIGLVNIAVPASRLDDEVAHWTGLLARGSPGAVTGTKRALNMVLRQQATALIDAHLGLETLTRHGDDHRAAIRALAAGQKPDFGGDG